MTPGARLDLPHRSKRELLRYFFFARRWKRVRLSIFLCFFLRMRLRRFLISDPMRTKKLVHAAGGHERRHLTVMRSVAGGDTEPFFSTASRASRSTTPPRRFVPFTKAKNLSPPSVRKLLAVTR